MLLVGCEFNCRIPDGDELVAVDVEPVAPDDEGEAGDVLVALLLLFNKDEAEFKLARTAARPTTHANDTTTVRCTAKTYKGKSEQNA
jgi:hypothetical protein